MLAQISEGHIDLADFLFLLASILFLISFLCCVLVRETTRGVMLVCECSWKLALTLFALAWFVL